MHALNLNKINYSNSKKERYIVLGPDSSLIEYKLQGLTLLQSKGSSYLSNAAYKCIIFKILLMHFPFLLLSEKVKHFYYFSYNVSYIALVC